ncbi:hypothetical protein G6F22_017828 [Rhizopus arrhizus]|nr:hypothetical protein G6F22_017828 [Rhizopus arrhizus]
MPVARPDPRQRVDQQRARQEDGDRRRDRAGPAAHVPADQGHQQRGWSGRDARQREVVQELRIVDPAIAVHRLAMDVRLDAVAAAHGQERLRREHREQVVQRRQVHLRGSCRRMRVYAMKIDTGAITPTTQSSGRRNRKMAMKVQSMMAAGTPIRPPQRRPRRPSPRAGRATAPCWRTAPPAQSPPA